MAYTTPVSRYATFLTTGLVSAGGETSMAVDSITLPSAETIDFTKIGDRLYLCINPGASNEEFVYVTSRSGTTFNGLVRGLSYQGDPTAAGSRALAHSAGEPVVATTYGGWFGSQYAATDDAETIAAIWTFGSTVGPRYDVEPTWVAGMEQWFASKAYADALAIAGAPNASTTQKGIVEEPTAGEIAAATDTGATGAKLFLPVGQSKTTSAGAADASKVPITTSRGILDETFLDLGYGYTAANAISAQAMVYASAANTIKQATIGAPSTVVAATDPAITGAPGSFRVFREDTDRTLIVSNLPGTGSTMYGTVATIDTAETNFTYGTPVILTGAVTVSGFDADRLTTNKYIAVYLEGNDVFAVVVSLSGNVVSIGTPVAVTTVNAAKDTPIGVSTISATAAVVSWVQNSDDEARMVVLSISGTTVTVNTPAAVSSSSTCLASNIVMLTATTGVVTYSKSGTNLFAKAFTISGTTPTLGSEVQLGTASTHASHTQNALIRMTDTKFVSLFNNGAADGGDVVAGTVSGTTITAGTAVAIAKFCPYQSGQGSATRVSDTVFLVLGGPLSGSMVMYTWEVDGTVPALIGSGLTSGLYAGSSGQDAGICLLRPFKAFAIACRTTATDDEIEIYNFSTTNILARMGAVAAAVADAASGFVEYQNSPIELSGLTAGTNYYIGHDGLPTTETSANQIQYGAAISTTKMMLK